MIGSALPLIRETLQFQEINLQMVLEDPRLRHRNARVLLPHKPIPSPLLMSQRRKIGQAADIP